jgi:CPA1 family monovalent cation:H+ antiporter
MTPALLIISLLVAVVCVVVIAKRFALPYPIVFVFAGIVLAFIPDLPRPQIDPNLIFLIVLPPLLYGGGWDTDWTEFRHNLRPIALLAVGLVVFTTIVVAWITHALTDLTWPMAFALGAIVAPPDAVAAEAIFERLAVPRRIVAVLTGEGLVNDATALVLYRFAVVAAVTGTFSLRAATLTFFVAAIGGVAIGLVCGIVFEGVLRVLARWRMQDAIVTNVLGLLAPYAAYLPADLLGVSGVLAVVTSGVYASRRAHVALTAEDRVSGSALWEMVTFLLNAMVFLLIGVELPGIIASLASTGHFVLDALIVSVAVIVLRIIWVYPAVWLPRALFPSIRKNDPMPPLRNVALLAWTGMRGIVSLAAALALPLTDARGAPLQGRSEIIFITLCVIVATLVLQGLSLAPLIRFLGIGETSSRQQRETEIRIRALEAGIARLHALEPSFTSTKEWEIAGQLLGEYGQRIDHLRGDLKDIDGTETALAHRLEREALDAERREIARLRAAGEIPDEIYRAIEYDLDLAALQMR